VHIFSRIKWSDFWNEKTGYEWSENCKNAYRLIDFWYENQEESNDFIREFSTTVANSFIYCDMINNIDINYYYNKLFIRQVVKKKQIVKDIYSI